ncbi:cytochrome c oxidase subunit 3 [uncultured Microscilla sp.]|uniref:cytochrome c oxidase subunit 3 n=1 Tax=uncultured Microscilla sp. TaxID=432653 RepID=UPI002634C08E|nr:cytochrome c oxidase subunit 3 [uncultured Microscilla sp.]
MTNKPKIKRPSAERDLFKRREPFHFMLWTAIAGISIMFLALTIIYSLRKGQHQWQVVNLPLAFWLSTFSIIASSLTLWQTNRAVKKEQFRSAKILLGTTLGLGLLFIGLQVVGWQQLIAQKVYLSNSLGGSFIYIISGLHIAHILGGILFLTLIFIDIVRHTSYVDSFIHSVNPPNQLRLKLVTIYWHFVDVLWLYLFLFFLWA